MVIKYSCPFWRKVGNSCLHTCIWLKRKVMYFLLISVILNPKPFYLLVHSVLLCSQIFSGSCKYLLTLSTKFSLGLFRKHVRTSVGFILKALPIHLYSTALNNCLWRGALSCKQFFCFLRSIFFFLLHSAFGVTPTTLVLITLWEASFHRLQYVHSQMLDGEFAGVGTNFTFAVEDYLSVIN